MSRATCCSECVELALEKPCVPCGGARHTGAKAPEVYAWWDVWLGDSWAGSIRSTERLAKILRVQLAATAEPWRIVRR